MKLEPKGQHDPDWTQIWTLGAWPNPRSGFKLGIFPRLLAWTWNWSDFWFYQPNFRPWGPTLSQFRTLGVQIGFEWDLGVWKWAGIIKKSDQIQVQANNLGKIPNLNPLLGLGQAFRVQIWVQSWSCWPSGSDFTVSSCLGHIQLTIIGEKSIQKQLCSNWPYVVKT